MRRIIRTSVGKSRLKSPVAKSSFAPYASCASLFVAPTSSSSSSSSSSRSVAVDTMAAAVLATSAAALVLSSTSSCDDEHRATARTTASSASTAARKPLPLDAGYRAMTDAGLAIVRKRPALAPLEGEPLFTAEEVAAHDDASGPQGLWMTYKDGVYDLTDFLNKHPGGARFLKMAAGGAVDSWWAYWHWHHTSPLVGNYLRRKFSSHDVAFYSWICSLASFASFLFPPL